MNRTLLLKVKEQILKEPNSFFMSGWVNKNYFPFEDYELTITKPDCGTAACIGGWTCLLGEANKQDVNEKGHSAVAAKLLGLEEHETGKLFSVERWPNHLYKRWGKAKSVEERAKIAAEVIDDFIENHCGKAA